MQIRPQDTAVNKLGCVKKVMVIAPVDPEKDEAQEIAEQNWNQRLQALKRCFMRWSKFEHHNSDNNRNNTVAEGFQSRSGHGYFRLKI